MVEERQVVGGDDRRAYIGQVLVALDTQSEQPTGEWADDSDHDGTRPLARMSSAVGEGGVDGARTSSWPPVDDPPRTRSGRVTELGTSVTRVSGEPPAHLDSSRADVAREREPATLVSAAPVRHAWPMRPVGHLSLALLGIAVACVVALHVVRPRVSPIERRLSEYAPGPHGWLMDAAFATTAVGHRARHLPDPLGRPAAVRAGRPPRGGRCPRALGGFRLDATTTPTM